MRRSIFSKEDLATILLGVNQASAVCTMMLDAGTLSQQDQSVVWAYRDGFKAALSAVALGVGISVSRTAPIEQNVQIASVEGTECH